MRGFGKSRFLLVSAALLAVDSSRLMAQPAPPPAPPAATQPAAATTLPTTRPQSRPATQISMQFRDASVDAVLEHLSAVAGFVVVKNDKIDGRVTIISSQPVSPAEAITLLNTVLKDKGYTAIQQERILKIVAFPDAKKMNIPVYYGQDPKQVPVTDNLVTQVIPIKTVDATKLKQNLTAMISPAADVSADSASNVIILTDTQANIHRIVEIISALDKRDPADSTIWVQQLKYADAAAAAKLIQDIFKPDDAGGTNANLPPQLAFFQRRFGGGGGGGGPGGFGGGGGPGGGGGGGAQDAGDKAKSGKVVASSDQRTNTVVVTGPAATLEEVKKVLAELDKNPASEQTFFIYSLKNAQAANLQGVLNSLFGGTGTSGGGRTGTNTGGTNRASYGTTGGSTGGFGGGGGGGRGGGGSGGFGGGGGGGFGGGGGGGLGGGGFGGTNQNASRSTSAFGGTGNRGGGIGGGFGGGSGVGGAAGGMSELMGQVYVVADQDTNSLLVATASKFKADVEKVIAQLDRPVAQVLIKVLIAEVTHDNSSDLGVDFSVLDKNSTTGHGATLGQNLGTAAATGGLVVNILERDLNVTIRALATSGKLDVLSRPYILASDNQAAQITVGSEVPFVTNTRIDSLGGQTNTIQYQDIGIILNVTPHVNQEGLVILDVSPEISNLTNSSVTISNGVTAPIYAKRSADTRVGIENGKTIVIGGLMQDQKTSTLQKVPILGDIPVIGTAFQRNQVTKTKTELLIFLTPHVALRPETLKAMSQDELKGTKLTPGAVEPGIFDDHIRGMQRGATTITPTDPATNLTPTTRPASEIEQPRREP
jgi:general secretion pathway protein D